jgi:uncharacterized membrane protein
MTTVRQVVLVDATPQEVWDVISDPRNLPHWNQHIHAVSGVPDRPLQVGDTYRTELRILGLPIHIRARVLELEPPRNSMVHLSGPIEAVVRTWVRPVGHSRARLEHEVEYTMRGGPVGALVARAVRYLGAPTILKKGIRAQKREVETG